MSTAMFLRIATPSPSQLEVLQRVCATCRVNLVSMRALFDQGAVSEHLDAIFLAAEDDKEAIKLNRVVRWTPQGLEMEADPRQSEKSLRDLKLNGEGVKAAASPGITGTREQHDGDAPLEAEKRTPYRAVVARANYLASERPELQFAANSNALLALMIH